jgi:hypothetical protein
LNIYLTALDGMSEEPVPPRHLREIKTIGPLALEHDRDVKLIWTTIFWSAHHRGEDNDRMGLLALLYEKPAPLEVDASMHRCMVMHSMRSMLLPRHDFEPDTYRDMLKPGYDLEHWARHLAIVVESAGTGPESDTLLDFLHAPYTVARRTFRHKHHFAPWESGGGLSTYRISISDLRCNVDKAVAAINEKVRQDKQY